MKSLLLALAACVGLMVSSAGCAEEGYYSDPPVSPAVGTVEFCDDLGCRFVEAPYYYMDGEVVYWDAHFGVWIGPHSYWREGRWYGGSIYGYHSFYHPGYYHSFTYHDGGWRAGSGYHGYYHGGGDGFRGGHGGGHR